MWPGTAEPRYQPDISATSKVTDCTNASCSAERPVDDQRSMAAVTKKPNSSLVRLPSSMVAVTDAVSCPESPTAESAASGSASLPLDPPEMAASTPPAEAKRGAASSL